MTSSQSEHPQLGLLPNLGGSLKDTAKSGQLSRLLNYYFRVYAENFRHIRYFSYEAEHLSDYTQDSRLLDKVTILPKTTATPYRIFALQMPWRYKTDFQQCHLLRVFQTPGGLPALMAKLLYGIPYVVTYGYKYHEFNRVEGRPLYGQFLKAILPLILYFASGVIVTTHDLKDYVANFTASARIHLIPNGVDTNFFVPGACPPGTKKGNTQPTILFIGRLTAQKNLARLFQALAQLPDHFIPRLLVVGEGPLRDELEALAKSLALTVEFKGVLPHHDLPHLLQQADVFVLPSLAEGHPKVLIEAMSCGLPCVVSNCQGNRNVVEDEVTALLFEPTDVSALAHQLLRVLETPNLAERLGRGARDYSVREFDLRTLLEQEVALLQALSRREI